MKLEICSAYDSKAQAFLPPFLVPTLAIAVRAFGGAANKSGTTIGDHPEDFTLFHLGTFDDSNAVFHLFSQYVNLGLASNFVKQPGMEPVTEENC